MLRIQNTSDLKPGLRKNSTDWVPNYHKWKGMLFSFSVTTLYDIILWNVYVLCAYSILSTLQAVKPIFLLLLLYI